MKKALFLLTVVGLFAVSCNNIKPKQKTTEKETTECTENISVDSFLVIAADYVGKELTVQGTVDHVCKHGGKRVKIFSSCPTKAVHAEAGEGVGQFKAEIEGSDICVTGIVGEHKMDLAYVEEYEAKIKEAMKSEAEEAEMEHSKGADHHATLEKVAKWKEEINSNGKGYISTYYLEVSKYQECEVQSGGCDHKHGEGHDHEATAAAPCCKDKKEGEKCADKEKKAACDHKHDHDAHAGHNH